MTLPPSIEAVTVVADFRTAITGSGVGGSVRFSLVAPRSYPLENITLVASETFALVDGVLEPTIIPVGEYVVAEQFIGGRRYFYNFVEDIDLTDIVSVPSNLPDYEQLARGPAGPEGPQGPIGPPGSGASFVHDQTTPSASWVVTHGLGYYPAITILDDSDDVVITDIRHNSVTQVTITFASPFVGRAVFS